MAEDEDVGENGQIKYSIDFGNNDGYFSIQEDSGQITLAKTIPLEENKILEFSLYVRARDGRSQLCFAQYPTLPEKSLLLIPPEIKITEGKHF